MKTFIFALLVSFTTVLAAQEQVRTIHLDHRTPQEVIEKVGGLLPPNTTIKPFDDRVVINSDKATYDALLKLLEDFDKPHTSINVQVLRSQRELQETQRRQDRVDIDTQRGATASTKRYSTRDSRERDQIYQARGIAGEPIMLNTAKLIPQDDDQVILRQDGNIVIAGTNRYISLENGFHTVVRLLADNRLQAEIYPAFSEQTRGEVIENTEIATTINGRIGEWIELGRAGESSARSRDSHRQYRSDRDTTQYIYLRVNKP